MTIYHYAWKNNAVREKLYGRKCIVLCRGKKNSILIQFLDDGEKHVVSRNAVRKDKDDAIGV